jgi:hypothetical protein
LTPPASHEARLIRWTALKLVDLYGQNELLLKDAVKATCYYAERRADDLGLDRGRIKAMVATYKRSENRRRKKGRG